MISRHLHQNAIPVARLLRATHIRARRQSTVTDASITPINSILIANRGEIALRVSRTAAQHGIRTTTIFTDPDAHSEHTLASPLSVNLGEASAYLDSGKIIEVAKQHGCDAIHPGYGFLSENAPFARDCEKEGLTFIGPSWQAIEAMGDKSRSKEIMLAAHVPCTPGYHGPNQSPSFLSDRAIEIGYPVLLKAVHGGGGKGMRIAQTADEFQTQLESAKSEARNSFGNDTMLVEKYITRPRHVEVQIFGDKQGNVVALGERDCSIQRRHQKIIEESPAPGLSDAQRKDLWGKAIQAGKAVNYVGAGTVEFILDSDTGGFYFMEMNTRLQVEHPVTEMCTGLDLVEWQVRVARGEPLPLTQEEIEAQIATRGHAFEARIYAEDPTLDFLPTAGTLTHLRLPTEEPDSIRIDTAIKRAPTTISSHYDPMISKLIVRGPDRETALKKLGTALEQYEVAGLMTNIEFLKKLCQSPHFAIDTAGLDTGFIAKHRDELFEAKELEPEVWAQAAIGLLLRESNARDTPKAVNTNLGFGASDTGANSFQTRSFELTKSHPPNAASTSPPTTISIQQLSANSFSASVHAPPPSPSSPSDSSKPQTTTFPTITALLTPTLNPQVHTLSSYFPHTRLTSTLVLPSPTPSTTPNDLEASLTIFDRGHRHNLTIPSPIWLRKALGKSALPGQEASVTAPMPSKILRVECKDGEVVTKDQPLVVVESMKMEMVVRAPRDGRVRRVGFKPGDICKAGVVLVEFEDEGAKA